jgi:hypothetical protein
VTALYTRPDSDDLIRHRVSLTWTGWSAYGGRLRALLAVKSPVGAAITCV